MKRKNKRIKTSVMIFVLFVGFMVIGSFGGIYASYLSAKNVLVEQTNEYFETIAVSKAHHINDFLEEHEHMVELLAFLTGDSELNEIIRIHPEFYEVFILDKNGKVAATTNPEEEIGTDFSEDLFFLNGKEKSYIKDVYYDEEFEREAIGISSPIFDETKQLLGVFVAKMGIDELSELTLDRTGLGDTGEIYLINKDSYMITPSRFFPEKMTLLKQKVDTVNARNCLEMEEKESMEHVGHEGVEVFTDYRGKDVLGTHVPIPEMQWCLLVEIDEAEALGLLKSELLKSALLTAIATSIMMVFFIFLSDYFIRRAVEPTHSERISKRRRR